MDNNPKETARRLRKKGYSLDLITKEMGVPRSTIYYWISRVPLTNKQLKKLEVKRTQARKLGGIARHNQRLAAIEKHNDQAVKDIAQISNRELFLIGIALYWAEGSKQKETNVSQQVAFINSDPKMIKLFESWLSLLGISETNRSYNLFLHKHYIKFESEIKKTWLKKINKQTITWRKTVIKKHDSDMSISPKYLGLLHITVKKSADLNRKINGWIRAMSLSASNKI